MNIKTKSFPYLPAISGNNKERVFTKHWANLPLHLNRNEMALLSFITFTSRADNTFKYSLVLFKKYIKAVGYANEEYSKSNRKRLPNDLTVTPMHVKFWFERLVENGWIIGMGKKDYMINPMLTYVPMYVSKGHYQEACLIYKSRPADVVGYLIGIVRPKIIAKKSNHAYWPE